MEAEESNYEEPPKRYIYHGPFADNISNPLHDDERTTRPPHLENQDSDEFPRGSSFPSNYIATTS